VEQGVTLPVRNRGHSYATDTVHIAHSAISNYLMNLTCYNYKSRRKNRNFKLDYLRIEEPKKRKKTETREQCLNKEQCKKLECSQYGSLREAISCYCRLTP